MLEGTDYVVTRLVTKLDVDEGEEYPWVGTKWANIVYFDGLLCFSRISADRAAIEGAERLTVILGKFDKNVIVSLRWEDTGADSAFILQALTFKKVCRML